MRRIFFAIPIPRHAVKTMQPLLTKLQKNHPEIVFSPVDKWHITLHFIGDVSEKALRAIRENFARVKLPRAHEIELGGAPPLGKFGNSVLYLRVNDTHASLHALHEILREMVPVRLGKRFHPHITLGRNPRHANLQKILETHSAPAKRTHNFGQIILYESISREGRTHYVPLAQRRLSSSKRAKTR